jgi:hypothetical protein
LRRFSQRLAGQKRHKDDQKKRQWVSPLRCIDRLEAWQPSFDRPMMRLSAARDGSRYGSILPIWSGWRKGVTVQKMPAKISANVALGFGFGLALRSTKRG